MKLLSFRGRSKVLGVEREVMFEPSPDEEADNALGVFVIECVTLEDSQKLVRNLAGAAGETGETGETGADDEALGVLEKALAEADEALKSETARANKRHTEAVAAKKQVSKLTAEVKALKAAMPPKPVPMGVAPAEPFDDSPEAPTPEERAAAGRAAKALAKSEPTAKPHQTIDFGEAEPASAPDEGNNPEPAEQPAEAAPTTVIPEIPYNPPKPPAEAAPAVGLSKELKLARTKLPIVKFFFDKGMTLEQAWATLAPEIGSVLTLKRAPDPEAAFGRAWRVYEQRNAA